MKYTVFIQTLKWILHIPLLKGVSLSSKKDRDFLLHNLPVESFGGGIKHPPRGNNNSVIYIKGVDTTADLASFTAYLNSQGVKVASLRLLSRQLTGKPTQIVKVTCDDLSASKLLRIKVLVNQRVCQIDRPHVIHCFRCQSLGHIAADCRNKKACEFCARSHSEPLHWSSEVCSL